MLQDGVRLPKAKVRGSNPLGCANNFNVLGAVCVRQRVWNLRELGVNDSPTVVAVWHTADTTANDAARARNSASLQAADEKRSAAEMDRAPQIGERVRVVSAALYGEPALISACSRLSTQAQ